MKQKIEHEGVKSTKTEELRQISATENTNQIET